MHLYTFPKLTPNSWKRDDLGCILLDVCDFDLLEQKQQWIKSPSKTRAIGSMMINNTIVSVALYFSSSEGSFVGADVGAAVFLTVSTTSLLSLSTSLMAKAATGAPLMASTCIFVSAAREEDCAASRRMASTTPNTEAPSVSNCSRSTLTTYEMRTPEDAVCAAGPSRSRRRDTSSLSVMFAEAPPLVFALRVISKAIIRASSKSASNEELLYPLTMSEPAPLQRHD